MELQEDTPEIETGASAARRFLACFPFVHAFMV